MKKAILLAGIFALLSFFKTTNAQTTGDFVIGFPSPDTLLTEDSLYIYFHVPETYQAANPTKLIMGIHGLGDPSSSELIRGYLAPVGDSLGAIIACPDPYLRDQPRSQLVINIAIDSILKWYNIDPTEMYISGYSAGSDVAAQYVLENPKHPMKGLIWFAPGYFYKPNLSSQADFPPTCLCLGDQDAISTALGQVEAIKDSFAKTNFPLFFNSIPGVAHTMNFPEFTSEILECMRFIEDPENTTGLSEYSYENKITIFPNPSNGNISIQFSEPILGLQEINIYDITGKAVFSERLNPGGKQYSFDLNALSSGIFGLTLISKKGKNSLGRLILR